MSHTLATDASRADQYHLGSHNPKMDLMLS